jgi:hypothetical protein
MAIKLTFKSHLSTHNGTFSNDEYIAFLIGELLSIKF